MRQSRCQEDRSSESPWREHADSTTEDTVDPAVQHPARGSHYGGLSVRATSTWTLTITWPGELRKAWPEPHRFRADSVTSSLQRNMGVQKEQVLYVNGQGTDSPN